MDHVLTLNEYLISWQETVVFLPAVMALVLQPFVSRKTTLTLVALSVLLALINGVVSLVGVLSVFGLFALTKWASETGAAVTRMSASVIVFILCLIFMLHLAPGFSNSLLVANVQISDDAVPYTKYVNFDKAMLAVALLMFIVPAAKKVTLRSSIIVALVSITLAVAVFSYALVVDFVDFKPKLSNVLLGWALCNLFLTCFAEEAVFRGFIQQKIAEATATKRWGNVFIVLFSGIFFGVVHAAGGGTYVILASVMGCAYAYAYHATQNIYVPVFVHFLFNLTHFTLFTYPFLQQ